MASRRAGNDRAAQNAQTLKALVKLDGNKVCADCKRNKHPRWASWNLGVFICIRCSGVHRGMGTHISRVKSVDLDAWTDEQLQSILRWGNTRANKYWEARLAPGHQPSEAKIENFIRTKYESKRWVMEGPMPDPSTLDADDDVPLNIVQEKAKIERSASQRLASTGKTQASRTGPAPAAPAPKSNESLLNLDFFGKAQPAAARPSSAASSPTAAANARGDLKNSILSLYASAPKPAPTQPTNDQQASFGELASAPARSKDAFGGLADAFGGLGFSNAPTASSRPAQSPTPSLGGLGSFPSTLSAKAAPSAPQVTSPAPPLSGGSFFDAFPTATQPPAPTPASVPQKPSSSLDFSFTQRAAPASPPAPEPAARPSVKSKPATSIPSDLFNDDDFGAWTTDFGSAFNLSAPAPVSSPPRPAVSHRPVAAVSSTSNAIFDPWSSATVDNSPWGAPEAAAPKPTRPSVELGKVPSHITPNDITGGWGAPLSSASKTTTQPTVAVDEDFGGWASGSTSQTPAAANPPKTGGGFDIDAAADDSHHVTEAIGHMYDDQAEGSGGNSVKNEAGMSTSRKRAYERKMSAGSVIIGPNSQIQAGIGQAGQALSPSTLSAQAQPPSDTALSPFPLNNIDYESSPAAVAKELSNLQALRRMSMNADLGAADDPDLPQFNAAAVPATPSLSEDDSSRLFWVPARLHPELAPKEFKTFLDSRAEQIKRRSGELSHLSTSPTSSDSGLQRKRSMLSRQIHSPVGYQDGADLLERKKSGLRGSPDLEELESLVSDSTRLSVEENGDIILPSVPSASLKRSKRTNYRRGGSLQARADRGTYAQRMARRAAGEEGGAAAAAAAPARPTSPDAPPLPSFSTDVSNLANTLSFSSEPPTAQKEAHNFSRPASIRSTSSSSGGVTLNAPTTFDSILAKDESHRSSTASAPERRPEPMANPNPRPESSHDKPSVPQIVQVPPPEDSGSRQASPNNASGQPPIRHPERSSSREAKMIPPPQRHGGPSKQPGGGGPPRMGSQQGPSMRINQPLHSLEQPSLLPGNNSGTQELTFIPTLTIDKRADQKRRDEPKKSGWGWFLGKEEDREKPDKLKHKLSRPAPSDNTRLDVLQTSIDGSKGRESIVLDRESIKLEEERKKESVRRGTGGAENKKEKDGFLSSIFGGKKGKEKDTARKSHRLSPEPAYQELKPDIDYNWTRFSILEERAIYRMAHIKLANPRRSLYSQVLLSNFMYSYLAKVQQMHPQMNLPTTLLSSLSAKTAQLKSITVDIYDNARGSHDTLDHTNDVFSSMGSNLRSSAGRLGRMARQGDRASVIKLAAIIVGVVLFLWFVVGGLWGLVFGR
ncbi:hypothetical protein DV735_g1128, partial [Chaetothyriales sp. CBS 134920]